MSEPAPIITPEFYIVMRKGIIPKTIFGPPLPESMYVIIGGANKEFFWTTIETRNPDTFEHEVTSRNMTKMADYCADIARFQELIRDLPPQYPGTVDKYGRDISLLHCTEYRQTPELDRSGFLADVRPGVPLSPYPPTDEEKARFDEAVEIVEKLAAAGWEE